MQIDRSLTLTLLSKEGAWRGNIGDFDYLTITERWLAQGTGEVSVSATHPKLPTMLEPGCRYIVRFRDQNNFESVVGCGVLRDPVGDFMPGGSIRFQLEDDWRVLNNMLMWVRPEVGLVASSLTDPAQSNEATPAPAAGTDTGRTGYWYVGPGAVSAEAAVRTIVNTHVADRVEAALGYDRYNASVDADRGPDVSDLITQFRFGTVAEAIVPLLEYANLGFRFQASSSAGSVPVGATGVFWEPVTWPTTLTPDSGVIVGGEWSLKYPTATDVVVGGPGELASRAFKGAFDASLREEYGDMIEVFRNATGAPLEWPTTLAEQFRVAKYYHLLTIADGVTTVQQAAFERFLDAAAADVLADGAPTSGVSLTLQESEGFRFGGIPMAGDRRGFATGDYVTVAPSRQTNLARLTFTERITETTLTQSANGLTITPQVGKRIGDPDREIAETIRAIATSNRRQATAQ